MFRNLKIQKVQYDQFLFFGQIFCNFEYICKKVLTVKIEQNQFEQYFFLLVCVVAFIAILIQILPDDNY